MLLTRKSRSYASILLRQTTPEGDESSYVIPSVSRSIMRPPQLLRSARQAKEHVFPAGMHLIMSCNLGFVVDLSVQNLKKEV